MSSLRYENTCRECGGTFIAKKIDAQYCDATCHRRFYDRANREKIRERKRRYEEAHRETQREYLRQYYEQNKDRLQSENRQRYALVSADPDKAAARQAKARQYYLDNREKILERTRDKSKLERGYRKLSAHGTEYEPLFQSLWGAQDGRCYLCDDPLRRDEPREVHLDHDHACCPLGKSCERCRRGLACKGCNYLIGIAKDDPERLRRIADNLARANEAVRERMQLPPRERERTRWELVCQYCGTPFVGYRQDTLYCSKKCMNRAQVERSKLRKAAAPPRVLGSIPCKQCGETFEKRNGNTLYCSVRCRKAAERQRNKARWAAIKCQ